MPPVPVPNGDYFFGQLAWMKQQIQALQVQQQSIISNLQGQPVIAFGLQPGSNPAEYGIGVLSQAFGSTLAFFGEDAAGNVGLYFYDASGNVGTKIDLTGVHVYNPTTGTEEARLGQLNASPAIYGLGVLPYGGAELQQVGGAITVSPSNALNVTNTTATPFSGTSTITAEIGPSGMALVTAQCSISTGTASQTGQVVVRVDSGSWYEFGLLSTSASGGAEVNNSVTFPWSALSAGTHTFQIGYATSNNGSATCSFTAPVLTVQPL